MLHPASAYSCLIRLPGGKGIWSVLRRPLFVAFLLGCMVSLVTSQRFTLRHVSGGAMSGCFILLGQIVALAIVCGRNRTIAFSQAIDLFFAGYGPWLLWILCFSAVWAFASPEQAFVWLGLRTILLSASLVALWSGYIDFYFFKRVLHRTSARAAWDLLRQRAISWSLAILIFGGGPLWPEIIRIFRS